MSRLGKKPIAIPEGVSIEIKDGIIKVKGPKGELSEKIHSKVKISQKDKGVLVEVENPKIKEDRALWGTFASLVINMLEGVTKGFEKKLIIEGIGFGWEVQGENVSLKVGFTHPVLKKIPQGLTAKVQKGVLSITGSDKRLVGEFAAQIKRTKEPEPYKGKGIRYIDEVIRRKAGKQAAGATKA